MPKRYKARWTDGPERSLYNGANAVVESDFAERMVCVTPNMATAERVAAALNFVEKFSDDEVQKLGMATAR